MDKNPPNNGHQPTGIPAVDAMTHGGIPEGSVVLLSGGSGTGKTIFTLQWLFEGYKQYKEPGLYISLTEPVVKILKNAQKFSFYDASVVGPLSVYFTDLRGVLEGLDLEDKEITFEDIQQITETLKLMVTQSKARRVVIDSITAMGYLLKERDKIRDFIFRLGTVLTQTGANVILTSEIVSSGYSVFGVEEFISDGIFNVSLDRDKTETKREFEIVKLRGTDYETFPNVFRITKDGLTFFPHYDRHLDYTVSTERVRTGIKGLDDMISGGVYKGSASLISGPAGSGKSILALRYIAEGLAHGEKAFLVSFEESEAQIKRLAESFGWDFQSAIDSGNLKLLCSYPEERYIEEHIDKIKSILTDFKAERVVIDSLSALQTIYGQASLPDFNSRLISYLKKIMTTSFFTLASDTLLGSERITNANISTMFDNIFLLRFVEVQAKLKHLLLILKMRDTQHDKSLRELTFTPEGPAVGQVMSGYEGSLSGEAKKVGSTVEERLHSILKEILGDAGDQIFIIEKEKGLSMKRIKEILNDLVDEKVLTSNRKIELEQEFSKLEIKE